MKFSSVHYRNGINVKKIHSNTHYEHTFKFSNDMHFKYVCYCVFGFSVTVLQCCILSSPQKANSANAECVFIEMVLENNYTAWMSARYIDWYVGFTKKGRPRRGPQTLPNQQEVHFMKRFPPGEQPNLQHSSFTTVSKRNRRTQETSASPDTQL